MQPSKMKIIMTSLFTWLQNYKGYEKHIEYNIMCFSFEVLFASVNTWPNIRAMK
jgi:hypothetical protein